jgi:hypothetical protein
MEDSKMLHIIGVAHRAQAKPPNKEPTEGQQLFARVLWRTIVTVRPTLIAEEDCEELLKERCELSIAKQIADELHVEHRFCDPNRQQRANIGYMNRSECQQESFTAWNVQSVPQQEITTRGNAIFISREFPKREMFWLEKLGDCRDRVTIFVCGDAHIKYHYFRRLLESKGMPYGVIEQRIGCTMKDLWVEEALDYLAKHPELMTTE